MDEPTDSEDDQKPSSPKKSRLPNVPIRMLPATGGSYNDVAKKMMVRNDINTSVRCNAIVQQFDVSYFVFDVGKNGLQGRHGPG